MAAACALSYARILFGRDYNMGSTVVTYSLEWLGLRGGRIGRGGARRSGGSRSVLWLSLLRTAGVGLTVVSQ